MGTRSLTHVVNGENETILTLYRQFDGYPSGMGKDIVNQFKGKQVTNGYNDDQTQVNGIGSLAAMLVAGIMHDNDNCKKCGNYYIYPPNSSDCGEEYTYTLSIKDNVINIKVDAYGKVIYDGSIDEVDMDDLEKDEED